MKYKEDGTVDWDGSSIESISLVQQTCRAEYYELLEKTARELFPRERVMTYLDFIAENEFQRLKSMYGRRKDNDET